MELLTELESWCEGLGPRVFFPNPPLAPEHLARVERRLGLALPPSYRAFMLAADGGVFHRSYLNSEPADLDILSFAHHDQPTFRALFDEMRWTREMPVDLLPVAADGLGNLVGFLVGASGEEWPVARFDQDALAFQPLGSSFRTLLRWICLEQELMLDEIGQVLDLPDDQREAREVALHRRLVAADAAAPWSLKRLALHAFDGGDLEQAERLLRAAVSARPDYAPAWSWLAEVLAVRGDGHRAARAATHAFTGRALPDGPRAARWDDLRRLLRRHGVPDDLLPPGSPLREFVLGDAPLDAPEPRVAVADALAAAGDRAGAVRQVEAALYLASPDEDVSGLFDRLEAWLRADGRALEADLARRDGNVYLEMSASMSMTIEDLDLFRE